MYKLCSLYKVYKLYKMVEGVQAIEGVYKLDSVISDLSLWFQCFVVWLYAVVDIIRAVWYKDYNVPLQ